VLIDISRHPALFTLPSTGISGYREINQTIVHTCRATARRHLWLERMLQGCPIGAVVGTAGAVGGTAKAAGSVVGAGVCATTRCRTRARAERRNATMSANSAAKTQRQGNAAERLERQCVSDRRAATVTRHSPGQSAEASSRTTDTDAPRSAVPASHRSAGDPGFPPSNARSSAPRSATQPCPEPDPAPSLDLNEWPHALIRAVSSLGNDVWHRRWLPW
jgi:hypothetical protein